MKGAKYALRILGVVMLVVGIWFFMEGGFRVSTVTAENLDTLIPKKLGTLGPCVASGGEKDVIVQVYQDQIQGNRYYFLEFSKNTLFDRYSLTDTWSDEGTTEPVYSVISSAIRSYPYEVDVQKGTVTLFEAATSRNVSRSIRLILCGIISLAVTIPPVWKRAGRQRG